MDTEHAETTTLQRYRRADEPLRALLDTVGPQRWDAPSPCEGWSARDVVGHLIDAQRQFLALHGCDLGPAPDLDADPAAAWRQHSAVVTDLLTDDELTGAPFDGYFGPTTVGGTLERFYVFDMVAHRWDLGRAVGIDVAFTDGELDELEAGSASFGDALYGDGVCAPAVPTPADADRQDQLLARLGRPAR